MERIYVKNSEGERKIYVKLEPIYHPYDKLSYEGTEIIAKGGRWRADTYELTYRDLQRMYEEGFHTIEPEEFEGVVLALQDSENSEGY